MQVMIIDDDPVARLALRNLVESVGFSNIIEFDDGLPAWQYLQSGPLPILCCCDIKMPELSGIELLEKIRITEDLAKLPFVLITSGTDREVVQEALSLGISGYIIKPFDPQGASNKLHQILTKQWRKIAEKPAETAERLRISKEKLSSYYASFKMQVNKLIAERQDDNQHCDTAHTSGLDEIEAMHKGCKTLGLWHCDKQFKALEHHKKINEDILEFLKMVEATIEYQQNINELS